MYGIMRYWVCRRKARQYQEDSLSRGKGVRVDESLRTKSIVVVVVVVVVRGRKSQFEGVFNKVHVECRCVPSSLYLLTNLSYLYLC